MASTQQMTARLPSELKTRIDAYASAMGVNASDLYREAVEKQLAEFQERAVSAVQQRAKWPGNVPAAEVEAAIGDVLKSIAKSTPDHPTPVGCLSSDLLGVRGLALRTVLNWIWAAEDESLAKTHKKIHAWIEELGIKSAARRGRGHADELLESLEEMSDGSSDGPGGIKPYPRRG